MTRIKPRFIFLDSVDNLRQTDVTLFESITLHERALVEHRKLHRNLTVLSDGVRGFPMCNKTVCTLLIWCVDVCNIKKHVMQ